MDIIYRNSEGEISFSGSTKGYIHITGIEGVGLIEKERKSYNFATIPGQSTYYEKDRERVITMSCDYEINPEISMEEIIRILYHKGELVLSHNGVERKIPCYCEELKMGETIGKYRVFAVQFICDSPYFTNLEKTYLPLFDTLKNIKNGFTLPAVLSQRENTRIIDNVSYISTCPTVYIFYKGKEEIGGNITLTNSTTATEIALSEVPLKKGDEIVIDIGKRTVKRKDGENLLSYLTDTSFLYNFSLIPGENVVSASADNIDISLSIEYDILFGEAGM